MSPSYNQTDNKSLNKLIVLQEDREKQLQEQFILLTESINQLNKLTEQLISVSASGSTVASTKKIVPFQTGSQSVGQLNTKPTNPDEYPTIVDIYKINDSRVIPHMTLVNDGPGEIFFISSYAKNVFNDNEGHLNVNDQRELFNVYEVRLRANLPLTTFRLIEGIFRTGSFAPATKANVEVRPTPQKNETVKTFIAEFDVDEPTLTVNSPTAQTFPLFNIINPTLMTPLPPGHTAVLIDNDTGIPMPFLIPEGFIMESFSALANLSTDFTVRNYFEIIPGTFTLVSTHPASNRGAPFNLVLNLAGQFSSEFIDPFGAPVGGRRSIGTITNDDPFNNMIGSFMSLGILRRLR